MERGATSSVPDLSLDQPIRLPLPGTECVTFSGTVLLTTCSSGILITTR